MSRRAQNDTPERGAETQKAHVGSCGNERDEGRFAMSLVLNQADYIRRDSTEQSKACEHCDESIWKSGKQHDDRPREGAP